MFFNTCYLPKCCHSCVHGICSVICLKVFFTVGLLLVCICIFRLLIGWTFLLALGSHQHTDVHPRTCLVTCCFWLTKNMTLWKGLNHSLFEVHDICNRIYTLSHVIFASLLSQNQQLPYTDFVQILPNLKRRRGLHRLDYISDTQIHNHTTNPKITIKSLQC